MFKLFSKGKEKTEWAALVFSKAPSHPEDISEEQLRAATGIMIAQHNRIILESAGIVRATRNQCSCTVKYHKKIMSN